ncbi:phage tail protein [Sphingomonas endophytica]|uniref:Tip attachment protein J domain-containing protein n=1 Tax=Sphingomonas endophytica TaxID=869719 RepID=A0A147I3I0_9SPHN|nr:phage tail protein [Sphingomonas endophytica]KTT72612.1 hypothetical protein NS334_08435 [Sphingomonas endophytica]
MAKALRHVYGPIGGLIIDGPKGLLRGTLNFVAVAVGGPVVAAMQVVAAGASLLEPKPKAPATLASSGDRLTVSINVREPRKIVLGSTAMATDLRDQEWSSDQKFLHRFIVTASHRVQAIREIWFDDKLVWTAAGGVLGDMAKWLQVATVLEGSPANAINIGPRMGLSRRYTGCAYVHLRYQIGRNAKKVDSPFAQSIPSRVTIIGDGAPVYDPRRDSTVPGGSGPQRANDQSTWEWNESAGRNPALAMLFYLLGWRINGRLAVGKGLPPARINLTSFIDAANLCDEPVAKASGGTEPRYRCDGVLSEGDATEAVLDNLKSTMNAVLDDVDGRLRVTVLHNDLAAPIGELGTADVLGAFTWQQTLPLDDSVSVIRGSFVDPSPASLYQQPDYPEVAIASRDGIERSQTVNYPLVQSASQAQRLSKQRLQRMLYGGTFTATFQSTAWKFQKGDVVRFSFAPLGWYQKLFRIADMATQVDGKVPMMLREENAAIYAWDASDAAPVTGVAPTSYDPMLWPIIAGIADVDARLGLVFNDNVITSGREKRDFAREWRGLEAQFLALDARYQVLGSPADLYGARTDAHDGYQALAAVLAGMNPAWDDTTLDTNVDGAALNQRWIATRQQIEAFAAAITGRKGERGADGASAFTLVDVAWTNFPKPNEVYKNGGGDDWTGKARTGEFYNGAASVAGTMDPGCFIGLTTDPTANASYDTIDYGLHYSSNGSYYADRNGIPFWEGAAGAGPRRGQVVSDGKVVRYIIDGYGTVCSHPVNARDEQLYGVFAVAPVGNSIRGITFSGGGAVGSPGASAPLVLTQWSINGVDGWHDNYFGADAYFRQSNDNRATWGPAVRGVGENGTIGADGSTESIIFLRSAVVPATPARDGGDPPPGWSDSPGNGTDFIWMSKSTFKAGVQQKDWSAPQRVSAKDGENGADGFTVEVSVASLSVSCDYLGQPKDGALPIPFTVKVLRGTTDVTSSVSFGTQSSSSGVTVGTIDAAGGRFQLEAIGGDGGFVLMSMSIGGVALPSKRIPIMKNSDQPPPSNITGVSRSFGARVGSTVYEDANASPEAAVLTASASGTIKFAASGSYAAATSGNQYRYIDIEGKVQIRSSGSSSWSDASGPVAGTRASYYPNDGPDPGDIVIEGQIGGLTKDANYEFRFIGRVTAGSTTVTRIYGGIINVSV